jgi:hypothetical protein
LKLGTIVLSQDLKGSLGHRAWVRASKGKYLCIGPDMG